MINFFKGILIGAGGILPGISSGVLCVVFGIYEKLIDSVLYFFQNIKENFKFLFPILLGGVIGVLVVSNLLEMLLYKFPLQTKAVFVGLIVGGIPLIISEIKQREKIEKLNIIYLIFSLFVGILMVYLEKNMSVNLAYGNLNIIYLIISGILMSIGVIVPGVSSTIILMLLGIYQTYLSSISNLFFPVLIPIGIGLIIGSLIVMKAIKILLDRYYQQTMMSIIGFTLGSILVLLPEINSIIDVVLFLICAFLGYYLVKMIKV